MDFDVINTSRLKLRLREKGAVGDVMVWAGQGEIGFALAQNGLAIRSDQTDQFGKIADASGPAVEHAELQGDSRKLRNVDVANDADEDEIAGGFLANVFCEQRSLEIREDAGRVHGIIG